MQPVRFRSFMYEAVLRHHVPSGYANACVPGYPVGQDEQARYEAELICGLPEEGPVVGREPPSSSQLAADYVRRLP